METVSRICLSVVPLYKKQSSRISKDYRERKTLMNKRAKLKKRLLCCPGSLNLENLILSIESDILNSHKSERLHEEEMAISKIKSDSNFFFRFAKKFSITNQDIGPFYNEHGDQITNKREISQLLLEQFSSVFSTPSNDKKVTNPDVFFLDNENETQLDDIIINDDHIISAVNEMSASSSKVLPIYKKDDDSLFSNYRPISLLPSVSKIFERAIMIQLTEYLEDNKLIHSNQYGFRKFHSTEYAALHLADYLNYEMDSRRTPVTIHLDLSKAFDCLSHSILLYYYSDFMG